MTMKGIFLFGDYGWLGRYRANSILNALSKLGKPVGDIPPVIPLDIFHACYLLNTAFVQNPDQSIVKIVEPILKDEELRRLTMMDDVLSRLFAVKFLVKLLEKLRRKLGYQRSTRELMEELGRMDRQEVTSLVQSTLNEVKKDVKQAKAYCGLKAGVGHKVSFGELLDLDFTVDLEELLKLFLEMDALFEKQSASSKFGSIEGVTFGRDITRLTPTALALPDELFWYRYVTSTLPLVDTKITHLQKFVLVVDKSGSMSGTKTLWSRAVALQLAKLAKRNRVRAKLLFFDYKTYPDKPIDLLHEFDKALRIILTLRCDGGTSIDTALRVADEVGWNIILVTDGEDTVSYKPRNKLISVMIKGHNDTLRKVSWKYLVVKPDGEGALKLLNSLSHPSPRDGERR